MIASTTPLENSLGFYPLRPPGSPQISDCFGIADPLDPSALQPETHVQQLCPKGMLIADVTHLPLLSIWPDVSFVKIIFKQWEAHLKCSQLSCECGLALLNSGLNLCQCLLFYLASGRVDDMKHFANRSGDSNHSDPPSLPKPSATRSRDSSHSNPSSLQIGSPFPWQRPPVGVLHQPSWLAAWAKHANLSL